MPKVLHYILRPVSYVAVDSLLDNVGIDCVLYVVHLCLLLLLL